MSSRLKCVAIVVLSVWLNALADGEFLDGVSIGAYWGSGLSKGKYENATLQSYGNMKWSTSYGTGFWGRKQLTYHIFTELKLQLDRDVVVDDQSVNEYGKIKTVYNVFSLSPSVGLRKKMGSDGGTFFNLGLAMEYGRDEYGTYPYYSSIEYVEGEPVSRYLPYDYTFWGVGASSQVGIYYDKIGIVMGYSQELMRFSEKGPSNMPMIRRMHMGLIAELFGDDDK